MPDQIIIRETLGALKEVATQGYALAMHVHFTTPTFLFQTYSKEWLDHYSAQGLVMSDPTVLWGFENRGSIDWSSLKPLDSQKVMEQAAEYGLKFGVTCAFGPEDRPSIGSFARADRPFTAEETDQLRQKLEELHQQTDNLAVLSPLTAQALREMSINYTHPN